MAFVGELILRAVVTAVVAVPLGFMLYNFMYYRYTNRSEVKRLVLEYLKFTNLQYDQSTTSWTRPILRENNQIEEVTDSLFYPSLKAIMGWVFQNEVIQKGIKKGLKYDEYFFQTIMGELMMEGRVSPLFNNENGEIVAYKFESDSL